MRKIILIIGLISLVGIINAKPIDKETLILVADNYLMDKVDKKLDVDTMIDYLGENSFYIIKYKGKGFAIVSSVEDAEPVLGYSSNSKIDLYDIPPALKDLFDNYNRQIKTIKAKKINNRNYREKWEKYKSKNLMKSMAYAPGVILLRPNQNDFYSEVAWGQTMNNDGTCSPAYNVYCSNGSCSEDCGGRYSLGCGAVAMGQIMWYWRWPQKSDYSSYDWDLMPPRLYDGSQNTVYGNQIGRLLKDCGRASDMDYNCWGSWTTINEIEVAFNSYFEYDADKHDRTWYSDGTWRNMILDEIDAGRPVLCRNGGLDLGDNHIFVFDGYNSVEDIHVNWGWRGNWNGFFSINEMIPIEDGEDYSVNQVMLTNIKPKCWTLQTDLTDVSYTSIASGTFTHEQANSSISLPLSGKTLEISSGGKYMLSAPNSISLKPGFWAKPGSDFHTVFRTCGETRNNSMRSTRYKQGYGPVASVNKSEINKSEESISENILISPNPTSGISIIKNLPEDADYISIYDQSGKMIKNININKNSKITLDISDLELGVYFVNITCKNKVFKTKILKI